MISLGSSNNNEYLKKYEAKQTYVQKVIYNADTTEIENDVSNLESRMTTAENNISTNTSNISTNTNNISTNTSDISNLQSRMTTAENNISTNTSNISTNTSNISTNTSNISTNTTDISNLKTRMTTAESNISTNTSNISTNTTDISNLKTRMTTAESNISTNTSNISTNTSNINNLSASVSTNTTDISNLKSRMTTAESNISTNTSNISNLQTQINNLNLGTAYEGLFYSRYSGNNVIIEFNYGLGNMVFWPDGLGYGSFNTAINNLDTINHCELSSDIETLILPGTIKKLNSDNTVNSIIKKLYYTLDPTSTSGRKALNSLKTITVLPDVWRIELNCSATSNLSSLNLFNGLEVLWLSNAHIETLKIPSTVVDCNIWECNFEELIFEDSNKELDLEYRKSSTTNKLTCKRKLTTNTYIEGEYTHISAPQTIEVNTNFLLHLDNNESLGKFEDSDGIIHNLLKTTLILYYSDTSHDTANTFPSLTFKSIHNRSYKLQTDYSYLHTTNWYN